ncbi:MAG: hypothetical protein EPO37_08305 [Nitrosarchaeum sp.]|nr:MAG: hypothetical protein EPO37_08305 [Nitrosarchaeum sp.]
MNRKNIFIIIGICAAFLTLMICFISFPFPLGWIIGIPLTIIVGVGISAISLWIRNPVHD